LYGQWLEQPVFSPLIRLASSPAAAAGEIIGTAPPAHHPAPPNICKQQKH